jgi:error-prone DNA polymerase
MGFYAPAQIVRNARENGVTVLPPDVNRSAWDNTLTRQSKSDLALQLGFRQIDGLKEDDMRRLAAARGEGYASLEELAARARPPRDALRKLADADAFRSIAFDRREALWEARRLPDPKPLPLFAAMDARELGEEPDSDLPKMALGEHVATDYQTLRLSLKAHPMALLRRELPQAGRNGVTSCAGLANLRDGAFARTAGLVLVRQRPGKGNAIFVTLEDETGVANLVLWARLFERFRRETMAARLMLAEGRVQKSVEGVVHLMTSRVIDRSDLLDRLWLDGGAVSKAPPERARHPREARIVPKSRDFH